MIFHTRYPCRVDGVRRGRRKPEIFHVMRPKAVEIREADEAPVMVSQVAERTVDYHAPRDADGLYPYKTSTYTRYGLPGQLYARRKVDGVFGRVREWGTAMSVLGVDIHGFVPVDALPDLSRIEEDHGPAMEADIDRAAARLLVHDGYLYFPVEEQFLAVRLNGIGEVREIQVTSRIDSSWGSALRCFRLDRMAEMEAFVAGRPGADMKLEEFRRRHDITVHEPGMLNFDPDRALIQGMAQTIISAHQTILATLDDDQITCWVDLRRARKRYSHADAKVGDTVEILEACAKALDLLQPADRLLVGQVAEFRELIATQLARATPPDDVGVIGATFGS